MQQEIPEDSIWSTGDLIFPVIYCTGEFDHIETPSPEAEDITQARRLLPSNARWVIAQLVEPQDIQTIIQLIQ